jgi:adenine-specific DNA-methyltransferase
MKSGNIEGLPFAFSEIAQAPIIARVEQILTIKRENSSTNTTQLEAEIDAMVYELYDLTPEEIAIVEGKS